MSAQGTGYTLGRKYLSSHKIEETTFEAYRLMGESLSLSHGQLPRTRKSFLLGWWQAGEQFHMLFKLEDADSRGGEKRLQQLRSTFGSACEKLEALLAWRQSDDTLQAYLQDAYEALDRIQNNLDLVAHYLKGEGVL